MAERRACRGPKIALSLCWYFDNGEPSRPTKFTSLTYEVEGKPKVGGEGPC